MRERNSQPNASQPIDLTTLAADVPVPPQGHPLLELPGSSPGDFPNLEMTREQMALKIFALEIRVAELEAKYGR